MIATGSFPLRQPIPGLESDLCVDSTGLLAQTEVPKRLVILGGGIIGSEFASIFNRFGSEVTIVEMLDTLIPAEDADAAKELAKAFTKRGITLQLGKQCTQVDDTGSGLAGAIRQAADAIRADRRTARLVAAELASAHATARMLAVLPLGVLLLGTGIGGDPVGFLTGSTAGLVCLAVGLALSYAGLLWLERIADRVLRR